MTSLRMLSRAAAAGIVAVAAVSIIACATSTQFDRAIGAHQWSDAASALNADTSLLHDESTLFKAAMLYTFPNRPTYDPARARRLFERLVKEFPASPNRHAAIDQLALLYELERAGNASQTTQQLLLAKIAQLEADTVQLNRSRDSIAVRLRAEQDQSALLRKITARLENDLQDREAQLRALHNELNHLKEIDLRPPARAQSGDTALKKPRRN